MILTEDILSIQVSELMEGRHDDFHRIDFITRDFTRTYTITVCPAHKNYVHWQPIVEAATEYCVVLRDAHTLDRLMEHSKCPHTGAYRLNADKKPTYIATYDRNETLARLKDELGLNPALPIADPLETLFGAGVEG